MTPSLPILSAPSPGPAAAACGVPSAALDPALDAGRLARLAKALSEPVRVQIVDVLRRHGEPLCQCELVPLLGMPQSTLSHHINKLADVGLVTVERRHRWAFYTADAGALEELAGWLT